MRSYAFLSPAREELIQTAEFYEARAPGLGDSFIAEVEHVIGLIRSNPVLGAAYVEDTRRILLQSFPFSVIYRIEPELILVVAFAHQRRRPGYWREYE